MARSEGRDVFSLSDLNAGGFLAFESKRLETVKEVQEQLLDTFEQFNRQQLAQGKQEMEFASEFAGKITSARSVPDVMNAYQNWISERMALYVEDGRKLLVDSQRVLNTTMKLLSKGIGCKSSTLLALLYRSADLLMLLESLTGKGISRPIRESASFPFAGSLLGWR
jgi:phasin protein